MMDTYFVFNKGKAYFYIKIPFLRVPCVERKFFTKTGHKKTIVLPAYDCPSLQ
jgi:hypothetical protein